MLKALVMDLDGTLLRPDNTLGERTVAAVRACRERGLWTLLATGRSQAAAEPYRALLNARGPMIYYNGALVADMPAGRVLGTRLLDREAAAYCARLARDAGVYFQAYLPSQRLIADRSVPGGAASPEREMYRRHTGILAELGGIDAALGDRACAGVIKGMFIAEPEALEPLRLQVEARFGAAVYAVRTMRPFLEVLHPEASKGRALSMVMEALGLSASEVMAFGDEENDLPLFAAAGFSAAPANAKPSVRAAASIIVPPNSDEGPASMLAWLAEALVPNPSHKEKA